MFGLKREIEEKTEDYRRRLADAAKAEMDAIAARKQRAASVKAEALAQAPAYLKQLRAAEAKKVRAFSFSCARAGDFLTVRLKNKSGQFSYAVNLASVSRIVFNRGAPITATRGGIHWDEYRWAWGEQPRSFGYGAPPYHEEWTGYPAPGADAQIDFKGADLKLEVPHSKGEAVNEAIVSAIAGGVRNDRA